MALHNLQAKPIEAPGYQPDRFDVSKPKEALELKPESEVFKGGNEIVADQSNPALLEEGQIRRAIEQAVEEVGPKEESGKIQHLSQEDLRHIIENVELNLGTKLDGMSPHQLLETLINLPRNNN